MYKKFYSNNQKTHKEEGDFQTQDMTLNSPININRINLAL